MSIDSKNVNSLESLAEFLREFVRKNTSKATQNRIRKWKAKGYKFPLILHPPVDTRSGKQPDNVLILPRKDHGHE